MGRTRLASLLFVGLVAQGCQTARMPLPETLSASERMAVSGRQGLRISERLRFGPYEAHQVSRSWTAGRERDLFPAARRMERRQSYHFTLREGAQDQLFVACHASLLNVSIDLGVVDVHPTDESALYCELGAMGDPASAWVMDLREQRERPLSGALRGGETRLQVVGTQRLERSLPSGATTGYEFRRQDTVIGAVEVINNGAVWLSTELYAETRRLLAAAAAALLLFEDLRATVHE